MEDTAKRQAWLAEYRRILIARSLLVRSAPTLRAFLMTSVSSWPYIAIARAGR